MTSGQVIQYKEPRVKSLGKMCINIHRNTGIHFAFWEKRLTYTCLYLQVTAFYCISVTHQRPLDPKKTSGVFHVVNHIWLLNSCVEISVTYSIIENCADMSER